MGRLVARKSSPNFLLRHHFNSYDANCDGLLSWEELKKAFRGLGSIFPSFHADRALHHADANMDGYVNQEEMDKLVEYAVRSGFAVEGAQLFRSRSVMPQRGGHDNYYGDSFTKADANNANGDRDVNQEEMDELIKYATRCGFTIEGAQPSRSVIPEGAAMTNIMETVSPKPMPDRSSSVMPRRDGHDKYYGDSFTKADANNANGDSSIQAIINANADSFIQANNANGDGLNINADAIKERFINEEEINEWAKYAARYGFTTSFGFLTKEQLMEKFKQCDVNNVRQLSRAELKKRFQYFNNEKLNKLVEHAPILGFTVEP